MPRLLLVVAVAAAVAAPGACCGGGEAREAVLAALVALHDGQDCGSSRLQGAQQLAALQEAVRAVNYQGGLNIGLRVYDTCSTPDGAVKATLKALVSAEEYTCLQPPLFLGFVGPDDPESVEAVSRVVHVFNLTHVVPWRASRPAWLQDHTLHVANIRHDRTAQAVIAVMRRAGWKTFLAAHGDGVDAARKTSALLQMAAGSEVCAVSPALRLSEDLVLAKLQQSGQAPSGLVLVVDSWSQIGDLLPRLSSALPSLQVVVVAPEVSRAALDSAPPAAAAVVLLLETSPGTSLLPDFRQRLLSRLPDTTQDPEDVPSLDVSVEPLAHAVRLYGAALRVAQTIKCAGTPTEEPCVASGEWHALMAGASVLADNVSRNMVSFSAELPTVHRVYLASSGVGFQWVGNITDGGRKLHLTSNWSLPAPPSTASCPASGVEEAVVQTFAVGNLWPSMAGKHGFYQAVGMMAGAGTGLVVLLMLCTWAVYRSFRVRSKSRSPASSVSSRTRRS